MSRNIKWMIAALVVSVAANIFMIGLSLGKNVVGGKHFRPPSHAPGINARALSEYLSDEERQTIRGILDEERGQIRGTMRRVRQNEGAIKDALRAEVVDTGVLNRLIDEHEALVTNSRTGVQRKLFNYMATLSPETRASIAGDLFKPPQRGRRGDRGDRFRRPPPEGDRFGPPPRRPREREGEGST